MRLLVHTRRMKSYNVPRRARPFPFLRQRKKRQAMPLTLLSPHVHNTQDGDRSLQSSLAAQTRTSTELRCVACLKPRTTSPNHEAFHAGNSPPTTKNLPHLPRGELVNFSAVHPQRAVLPRGDCVAVSQSPLVAGVPQRERIVPRPVAVERETCFACARGDGESDDGSTTDTRHGNAR